VSGVLGTTDLKEEWNMCKCKKEGFVKHDQGKAPLHQLLGFPLTTEFVARRLQHGAEKYSQDNWRKCETFKTTYLSAALRHLTSYYNGELFDSDHPTETHLEAAICSLLFINELERELVNTKKDV
jgi:hypothetical protein